jgi:hypothetical protein
MAMSIGRKASFDIRQRISTVNDDPIAVVQVLMEIF